MSRRLFLDLLQTNLDLAVSYGYVDKLGNGHKIIFPINIRKFLSWGPKAFSK